MQSFQILELTNLSAILVGREESTWIPTGNVLFWSGGTWICLQQILRLKGDSSRRVPVDNGSILEMQSLAECQGMITLTEFFTFREMISGLWVHPERNVSFYAIIELILYFYDKEHQLLQLTRKSLQAAFPLFLSITSL